MFNQLKKWIKRLAGATEEPFPSHGTFQRVFLECNVTVPLPERNYLGVLRVIEPGIVYRSLVIPGQRCSRIVMNEGHAIPLSNDGLLLTSYDCASEDTATVMRELLHVINANRTGNRWVRKPQGE